MNALIERVGGHPLLAQLVEKAKALFRRDAMTLQSAKRKFLKQRGDYYEHFASVMEKMQDRSYTEFFRKDVERYGKEPRGILSAYWLSRAEGSNGESQMAFLSEIFSGTVPQEDIAVLAIAERAGDVKEGMKALARSIKSMDRIKRSIYGMLGSLIVTFVIIHADLIAFGYMQMPTVVESMAGLLTVDEFGPKAKAAYYVGWLIRTFGWAVVTAEIFAVYWVVRALPVYTGRFRPWLDQKVLPFKFYRTFASTQFLAGLSGITKKIGNDQRTLREGLEILQEYSRPWVAMHVQRMRSNLDHLPSNRGAVFDTGLFDRQSMHWIEDLSDHEPDLSTRLEKISDMILSEAPVRLERAARRILAVGTVAMMAFVISSYFVTIAINTELKTEVKTHFAQGN